MKAKTIPVTINFRSEPSTTWIFLFFLFRLTYLNDNPNEYDDGYAKFKVTPKGMLVTRDQPFQYINCRRAEYGGKNRTDENRQHGKGSHKNGVLYFFSFRIPMPSKTIAVRGLCQERRNRSCLIFCVTFSASLFTRYDLPALTERSFFPSHRYILQGFHWHRLLCDKE